MGNDLPQLTIPTSSGVAVVGFRATEAKEAVAGFAESFAAEASNAEVVVGSLQQVQRKAVARVVQSVADRGDVWEDVERRGRVERFE